jgi:mannose-6-phosphate isomerase-like protein (cupin superfamily)
MMQGQLSVQKHDLNSQSSAQELLGQIPYKYFLVRCRESAKLNQEMGSGWIVYDKSFGEEPLLINGVSVEPGHCLAVRSPLEVTGTGMFIFATHPHFAIEQTNPEPKKIHDCKTVSKPWGYEVWMTGESSETFVLKKIFLKAGSRTSLQYHQYKRETNFLFSGHAVLHYAPDTAKAPSSIGAKDIATRNLESGSVVDVFPLAIHRLEAATDICLYEISTPEVDDVIRIQDDSGRQDGRILSEHR